MPESSSLSGSHIYPFGIIGSIYAPPLSITKSDELLNLTTEMLTLLRRFGIASIWTNEPRAYRDTLKGHTALANAFSNPRFSLLAIIGAEVPSLIGPAGARLRIGSGDAATSVVLHICPREESDFNTLIDAIAVFVRKWFARLHAGSASIAAWNHEEGDLNVYTSYDYRRTDALRDWSDVRRFIAAPNWVTVLGPDLCELLGGADRVVREVSTPIAHGCGDGIWLQLSAMPPAPRAAQTALASFLAPILDWHVDDVYESWKRRRQQASISVQSPPAIVPIDILGDDEAEGEGVVLNVHFRGPATIERQASVIASVLVWYEEQEVAGEAAELSDPTIDETVIRWTLDVDPDDAGIFWETLAKRLRSARGVEVTRIVLGTETVG